MRGSASLTIKRARFEERISRFAALYGADRHWQRGLFPRGKIGRVSCAELTPLLVRENHQPVVIFGAFWGSRATNTMSCAIGNASTAAVEFLAKKLKQKGITPWLDGSYPRAQQCDHRERFLAVPGRIQSLDKTRSKYSQKDFP